ncbi:MAG: 5-(carboxyamino)imidazole ribonucleotide synthase [Actinobacteria bacterium]|nr:5-(carboxyamino)imidazole ribonucleotide synthase [Actinomycetota bacterium]
MMAQAAPSLGIEIRVLASPSDTSVLNLAEVVVGDYRNVNDVLQAAKGVDVITFDHEHVPRGVLEELLSAGHVLRPSPKSLELVQDKLHLREQLAKWGVPQPKWHGGPGNVKDMVRDFLRTGVAWPLVVKRSVGGYDGKGVWVLRDDSDLSSLDGVESPGWVVEEFCEFRQELSAQVARSPHGQGLAYQVVQTTQVDGICTNVIAPAPDIDEATGIAAQRLAMELASKSEVTGMLAVELFCMPDGQLLVNELAMRPHNSGHWSIDGAVTSQFENHLRAVLDLPLGSVKPTWPYTVMVNVLGVNPVDESVLNHVLAHDPGARVHIYGKEFKLGRKLAHVNVSDSDPSRALARAQHAADRLSGTIR